MVQYQTTEGLKKMKLNTWKLTSTSQHGIDHSLIIHAIDVNKAKLALLALYSGEIKPNWKELKPIDTNQFKTDYDNLKTNIENGYRDTQYNKGMHLKDEFDYATLSINLVWGASTFDGLKSCYAYETIGLHANTQDLLEGIYMSGLPIVNYQLTLNRQ
jgi:hypothetical protein